MASIPLVTVTRVLSLQTLSPTTTALFESVSVKVPASDAGDVYELLALRVEVLIAMQRVPTKIVRSDTGVAGANETLASLVPMFLGKLFL